MKSMESTESIILVVETRNCQCGASFSAPNPHLLRRHPVENFRDPSSVLYPFNGPIPFGATQEILTIDTKIKHCPHCFREENSAQHEFWPRPKIPMIFTDGNLKPKPKPKPNPHGLSFWASL